MKGKTEKILCGFSSIFPKYLGKYARKMRTRRYETGSEGKFASRWRAKSPDALCAVLPKSFLMNSVALSKNLCKIVKKYLYFACSYAIIKVLTGRVGIPDVSVILDNTAQSPPDGFVRNLLADFPSYCPEIPCHTAVCLRNFYAICRKI